MQWCRVGAGSWSGIWICAMDGLCAHVQSKRETAHSAEQLRAISRAGVPRCGREAETAHAASRRPRRWWWRSRLTMMIQILVCATLLACWLAARPKRGRSCSSSMDGRCGELQGRSGRPRGTALHRRGIGKFWPDLGPATAIFFRSLCCWGKLRDANREASRGDVLTPGLCETDAGRLVTQRRHETTSMSKKTASPAKEDRIKTRPRPDPSKPLRPDLSQMCQKGLPGRLSAMADPRATLILFPSPVVRPIPSRSSRGSPWQQTVACRALPCRGRGQLRSIQSTAAEFWNSSVELVSRDDSLRAEMVRWSSWCSPTTPPTSSWRAKQGWI